MLHVKRRIANLLMARLWNAVDENKVLSFQKRGSRDVVVLGGKELPAEVVKELAVEARFIQKTRLYPLLREVLQAQMNKNMYLKSKTDLDMFFSKAGLWYDDVWNGLIEKISKIDS